jgi:hypothetical protein
MIMGRMLPSEKLELAIFKFVNAFGPFPAASASVVQLSQETGEKDYGRVVERLQDLDANRRILLTKYKGGSRLSLSEFGNDGAFFYTDSFLIEIAPQGRKYFEELQERSEQEKDLMTARKSTGVSARSLSSKKAIDILRPMVHNSAYLSGEPFGSPKREEWTGTAKGALARAFAPGSPVLDSFRAAQSISFNASSTDEELRRVANENLATQVAVLKSAIEQLGWDLGEETPVTSPKANETRAGLQIFISHSSKDRALAEALIDLLKSALGIPSNQIRCSSVDGHRLPIGVDTQTKLRGEVTAAKVVIGLVTPNSLASSYVMFELGARWGAELFLAPLLAGVNPGGLSGPLSLLNALSTSEESQIHQFLDDVSKELGAHLQSTSSYLKHVSMVKKLADSTTEDAVGKSLEPEIRQVGAVNYYYIGDKGPYCQPCYDEKGKRIFLTPPQEWNGGVRRKCEVCNKYFYEQPMTDFPGPIYVR